MKPAYSLCLALIVGSLVAACGGESDWGRDRTLDAPPEASAEDEPIREVIEVVEVMLARIRVGTTTIEFTASGDGPDATVVVGVRGTGAMEDPISRLMQQYGELTNLELFLAFAPDIEPPAVLVATHPGSARAMGRSDDAVIQVEPVAGAIVEL